MGELSERVVEVRAIAAVLWFLPPPARPQFADKLHGLGLRMHSELATLELFREGPKEMGNHAPQRVVQKTADEHGMDALRQVNPDLVARIEAAHADQSVVARLKEAKTEPERVALARELGLEVPDDIMGQVDRLKAQVDSMQPEDLE
jgi:hypothetical protein